MVSGSVAQAGSLIRKLYTVRAFTVAGLKVLLVYSVKMEEMNQQSHATPIHIPHACQDDCAVW